MFSAYRAEQNMSQIDVFAPTYLRPFFLIVFPAGLYRTLR